MIETQTNEHEKGKYRQPELEIDVDVDVDVEKSRLSSPQGVGSSGRGLASEDFAAYSRGARCCSRDI